jgi:tRNA(fMet)-specific endonuclease VapC
MIRHLIELLKKYVVVELKKKNPFFLMKYLLDTNICIHYLRGKFELNSKFDELGFENFAISEITLAELLFGAENSLNPAKNHDLIERFSELLAILPILDALKLYSIEKVRLRKSGQMISDFDLLIGTTSIVNGLIMVTENVSEFERINNIVIENWIQR